MRILFLTPLGFHVSFCLLEAADLKVLKVCFPLRNLEIHHENQYIYGIHVFVSFFPYRIWRLEIAKLKDMGIFSSDFLPMVEVAIFRMPKRGPIGECNWCCEVTPWKIHILEPKFMEVDASDDFPDFKCGWLFQVPAVRFPGCVSVFFYSGAGPIWSKNLQRVPLMTPLNFIRWTCSPEHITDTHTQKKNH